MLRLVVFLLVVLPSAVAADSARRPTALLELDGEVRFIVPLSGRVVIGGPGHAGHGWYAIVDPAGLGVLTTHRFGSCASCDLMAATSLNQGGAVMVGSWTSRPAGTSRAWVVLLDASGKPARSALLPNSEGARINAVAAKGASLLIAGERVSPPGHGVESWASELSLPELAPRAEWSFPDALPSAATVAKILGDHDFLVGGWRFDAQTAQLGGWLARLAYKGEPLWLTHLDGADSFEPVGVASKGSRLLVLGHLAHARATNGELVLGLRLASVDLHDGRVVETWRWPADDTDTMAADMLSVAGEFLLLSAKRNGSGATATELLRFDETHGFTPLFTWRDATGRRVPAGALRLEDGSLL
ncbi:MAG: hypothetical protein D6815_06615, partial [Candidatus Dadabacteria bacterium]